MQQYREWEPDKDSIPAHVEKAHKQALQMLTVRAASEASVAADKPADATLLAGYMAYIKLEEARPIPCICAHEGACSLVSTSSISM